MQKTDFMNKVEWSQDVARGQQAIPWKISEQSISTWNFLNFIFWPVIKAWNITFMSLVLPIYIYLDLIYMSSTSMWEENSKLLEVQFFFFFNFKASSWV